MKRFRAVSGLFGFAVILFALPAHGQATDLWQIGKLDYSDLEFKAAPAAHVVYQVGKSDWSRGWPAVEQVGADYEIRFHLEAAPHPNVALVTWKLAENGQGTILRLKELAGRSEEVTVTTPYATIRSASLCDSVEDNLHDLPITANQVHLTFKPFQVLTVRLNFEPRPAGETE